MNNSKVKEIIKFSLYKNIENKWFIIFNIVTLITTIFVVNWGSIANFFDAKKRDMVFDVAVLDKIGLIYDEFENNLSNDERFNIFQIQNNDYNSTNIPDNYIIIEISEDKEEMLKVAIISKEAINVKYYNTIKEELFKIRNNLLAKRYALRSNAIDVLQRDIKIERTMLSVKAEDSNTKEIVKFFSSALIYIITVFIFSKMANEIASEKQSKSTEYLLTCVSEKEYLFAKIVSNVVWFLLQGLFIIVYYYISVLISYVILAINLDISITKMLELNSFNEEMIYYIFMLIVYSILNLVLLCIIQATLASKTSSTTEASNSVSFLLIIMMIGYISTLAFLRPYQKVSLLLYIISCIPIFSVFFVPGIIIIGQAKMWQIVISLIVLIVSIPITFNHCAKIFKNGILDYTRVKRNKERNEYRFLAKREMKSFGFVIGIAIIIYTGTQTIFYLLGSMIIKTVFRNLLLDVEINMILQILLQVISLGLASSFVFSYTKENHQTQIEKRQIDIRIKMKLILISLFLVFIVQIILSLVLYPLLGLDYDTTDIFKVNNSSRLLSKVILVITLSIIPSIFEELFFRKAIIGYSIKFGKIFALLFSSLLFGIIHMNLSQGLFAFVMGLIFGSLYLYTGDIKYSILVHFLNNVFAALCLVLPEIIAVAISAGMFILVIIGFILFIKMLVDKESRKKLIKIAKIKVNIRTFEEKYQYIFTDYAFDISLIFVVLMTIMTEKILR